MRIGSAEPVGRHVCGIFAAGPIERESRLWHGMERWWRHHPVDLLDPNSAKKYRRDWEGKGEVSLAIQRSNNTILWIKIIGITVRWNWLAPEGVTPLDLIAHGLLGVRRDVDEAKWATPLEKHLTNDLRHGHLKRSTAFNAAYFRPTVFVGVVPPPPYSLPAQTQTSRQAGRTKRGTYSPMHMDLLPTRCAALPKRLVDRTGSHHCDLARVPGHAVFD